MVAGTALSNVSLTSVANAYPTATPISLVTVDNNPFYAVNRIQFTQDPVFNPSSTYQFIRRFKIQASASSSSSRLKDLIWFPVVKINAGPTFSSASLTGNASARIKIQALADSSSELVAFSAGVVTLVRGTASSNLELNGNAVGSVNVFAQAEGVLELSVSGSARVSLLRGFASGSAELTSNASGGSTVLGTAEAVSELTGVSEAFAIISATSSGESELESEAEALIRVSAIANSDSGLEGESIAAVDVSGIAESNSELEGQSFGTLKITNSIAESGAELESFSFAEISLVRATAEGEAELISTSNANISVYRENASSEFELVTTAVGNISLIRESASSETELSGICDAEVITLSTAIDAISWEEAFDFSTLSVANYNSLPNFGDPAHSPTAATADIGIEFSQINTSSQEAFVAAGINQSTGSLLSSGIGSNRINKAVNITSDMKFYILDGGNTTFVNLGTSGPVHFRWITTFPNNTATGNYSCDLFQTRGAIPFLNWGVRVRIAQTSSVRSADVLTSYRPTNGVNFTNEFGTASAVLPSINPGDWILVDAIIRNNNGNAQFEVIANGVSSIFNSARPFNGRLEVGSKYIAQVSSFTVDANMIFFGYRLSDFTLAEHNAELISLGL